MKLQGSYKQFNEVANNSMKLQGSYKQFNEVGNNLMMQN